MKRIGFVLRILKKESPRWLTAAGILLYLLTALNLSDFGFQWKKSEVAAEAIGMPASSHQCECHHAEGEDCPMHCCTPATPETFDAGDGPSFCECGGAGDHEGKALVRLSFHLVSDPGFATFSDRFLRKGPSVIPSPLSFFPSPPEKVPIA